MKLTEKAEIAQSGPGAEAMLRSFVENAPAGLAMFDRDLRYLLVSRRYAEHYRLDHEALVGRLHTDVFPDAPERWKDVWQRCLAGAVERAVDDTFPRADGTVDYVNWEMRPWHRDDGSIGGLLLLSEIVTERKLAALALAESQDRFRTIFEDAPTGMAEVGRGCGVIARANARLGEILGQCPDELWGRSLVELAVVEDRAALAGDLAAVCEGQGRIAPREVRLARPSGDLVVARISLSCLRGAGDGVIVTVEDLTRKRAAEASARAAEAEARAADQRWAATIQASPLATIVARAADAVILDANPASERLYGWPRDQMIGRSSIALDMFADPGTREGIVAELRAGGTGHSHRDNVRVRRKDGDIRLVNSNSALVTVNGEPCIVSTLEDVTEAQKKQAMLRAREEQLRMAFDSAPVGMVFADVGGTRWTDVNQRFCDMLGYTREELLQKTIEEVTHPADRAHGKEDLVRLIEGEIPEVVLAKRYLRKDGRPVDTELRIIVPPAIHGETPRRLVAAITDVSERVRAERDAREAETRWAATILVSPLAVAVSSVETGTILDVNPAFERLVGYTREELVGKRSSELGTVADPAQRVEVVRQLSATGRAYLSDLRMRAKSGEERITLLSAALLEIRGAKCFVSFMDDVTERRRAEATLTAQAQATRAAFDMAPVGIGFAIPGAERWVDVNQRLCDMLGYTREELLHLNILDITHADDRERARENLRTLDRGEAQDLRFTKRYVRKDGRIIECDLHVVVPPPLPGEPRRTIAAITDVTDRRRALDALAASETRYRDLIENLEDVVLSTDRDGDVIYVNPAIARFGYTPEELIGHSSDVLVPPDERPKAKAWRAEVFAAPGRLQARERMLVDKSGKAHPVRNSPRPMVRNGKVVGLTTVIVDLTAQREAEEQLRASQRMEAVGRLAGGVAHDFNNLLTVILSYAEIARAELAADSSVQPCLDEVILAGKRAEGLTKQLLAFSRKQLMVLEPLALEDVVTRLSALLRRLIGEDILLNVRVARDLSLVKADRGQVEQMLMNLVINSRDAMPDGGTIMIGAREAPLGEKDAPALQLPPGDYVELSVTDTGTGMDEGTRARIFEPFFTTKGVGKGTGLGLSTVYGIVKQLGGAITVDSHIGTGTTFRIYLPTSTGESSPPEIHREVVTAARAPRGNECILVVEDDSALRRVLRRLLSGAGYRVIVCGSPEEALEVCRDPGTRIDLVLTDVVMPGMNGRELARQIDELIPGVLIVYMSGYTDDALERLDVMHGHFLRKPFANDELRALIRDVLDQESRTSDLPTIN